MTTIRRIFNTLLRHDPQAEQALPEAVRQNLSGNSLRLVAATALQSTGDETVKASTVLPWLFQALGVPAALVGLLVPIRESGSMLPQALLTPFVLRVHQRKWVFVAGALIQAAMVASMALIAAFGHGLTAGILILVALTVFSLGRSLSSISSKDVLGRTVPKGARGQINGLSTTASGIVAVTVGLGLRVVGGGELSTGWLAGLLAAGAFMWVLSAVVYARVREPVGADADHSAREDSPDDEGKDRDSSATPAGFAMVITLLREDAPFRRFVIVRSLLLVSALSPPFIVSLSVSSGAGALSGLGGFIVASGLSALVGGPIFGRLADRASRTLMAVGAGFASGVLVLMLIVTGLPSFDGGTAWGAAVFVGTYFILTLVHTGVRVARKTYVVDMATGDQRTNYVAASNSAMGIVLLAAGGISSLLSLWGINWALMFLAVLGLLGVLAAAHLPDVSAHRKSTH